jgi:hypothetical protein
MVPFARVVLYCLLFANAALLSAISAHAEGDPCTGTGKVIHSDRITSLCLSAYCQLPSEDRSSVVESNDFVAHVLANQASYQNYLDSCFVQWDDPRPDLQFHPPTKDFLSDIFGVLLYKTDNTLSFICSAFRVKADLITTARHCVYSDAVRQKSITNFVFRLISSPNTDIPIIGEIPNASNTAFGVVANDFDDYWFLKLPPNSIPFHKSHRFQI